MLGRFEEIPEQKLTYEEFKECIQGNYNIVEKSIAERFVIPEFKNFQREVKGLFDEVKQNKNGKVADYIPELAKANPDLWGVSICSIDGQRMSIGDWNELFSV